MTKKLTGLNPLAYLGVEPTTPAQFLSSHRNPTTDDYKNFDIGTVWINNLDPASVQVWILTAKAAQVATWTQMAISAGSGASDFVTDLGTVFDLLGIINILGGSNITTDGLVANTVNIALDDTVNISGSFTAGTGITATTGGVTATAGDITASANNIVATLGNITATAGDIIATAGDVTISAGILELPDTTSATAGVINFNALPFIHKYGSADNLFVGTSSGNFTLTGTKNLGIGSATLQSVTSGPGNVAVGQNAGNGITTGDSNVLLGSAAGFALTTASSNVLIGHETGFIATGDSNVMVGFRAGLQIGSGDSNVIIGPGVGLEYIGAESSNILINSDGVAAESNIMRLGAATGSGVRQLAKSFIHGIRGVTTDNADAIAVLIDSAGQLGTVSSSRVYKENIVDMRAQSAAIMSLQPVTFNYKSDSRKTKQYGLIAEDVNKVMPELVVYNKEGHPETVKYHLLTSLLLNELQRLSERVTLLENSN